MIDAYQSQSVPSWPRSPGPTEEAISSEDWVGAICRPPQTARPKLSVRTDTAQPVCNMEGGA